MPHPDQLFAAPGHSPELAWTIVVAGGTGTRFGSLKQFAQLEGRSLLEWSVDTARAATDGVVVVLPAAHVDRWPGAVAGGATRSESVRRGLGAVPPEATIVCVHDAVRPFASSELYGAVVAAVHAGADGAIPAVPVTDTIKRVDASGLVRDTPPRDELVAVQTPQAFRASALRAAHADGPEGTDDAALVEAAGGTVIVVPGDPRNRKITRPDDLPPTGSAATTTTATTTTGTAAATTTDAAAATATDPVDSTTTADSTITVDTGTTAAPSVPARPGRPEVRIGNGFDVHRFSDDPDRPLVLGGCRFDGERGLVGHSDSDVVAHAVAEALLGASGLGDLGQHFPDTDERWRDVDSIELLGLVVARLAEDGWRAANVDCSVVCEAPKLAPRRDEMQRRLSEAVGAPVSVKGRRAEGLGALGRREGIACWASAIIEREVG